MSYLQQSEMASNASLTGRVAACAAEQEAPADPDNWAVQYRRTWAAAPGWDDAWAYARNVHPEPEYDPGADEGVITDQMILSQVQLMLQVPTPKEPSG